MFRSRHSRWIQNFLRKQFLKWKVFAPQAHLTHLQQKKILVLGIYLANRPNCVSHLVSRFAESHHLNVTQHWVALNGTSDDPSVQAVTVLPNQQPSPKFSLLNTMLASVDLTNFDAILISDDDITVPEGFIDAYFAQQWQCGFALAQPSRAWHSFYDHKFTLRKPFYRARQTRFVEIGPIFSIMPAAFPLMLPFDETSPMGWGYDFVWPVKLAEQRLTLGIIDNVSVDHSHRGQGILYCRDKEISAMDKYLGENPHLTQKEATQVLRYF